ncbi:S1 family peptidase [Ureibacillus thermosphaericus]|uniref:Peptidase S1 domain-containing protein n=1 Tax=Ureibacillus thermosphaericus TaxID=51173 RepID=A0A840Q075_URETH|nr:S1 family peptidase [Ureibacillus thermosphaericus]MBB5150321.1 hypothetical protein [Ureibacillus thermosphaericus]NKZ32947.1 hypothetical protein [Ureibacillus thermosphaericus]
MLNYFNATLVNQNIKILDITLNMKFNKLVIGVEDNNSYVTNTLKNLYGEKRIDVIKVSPLQNDSRTDYYYTLQGGLRIVSENKDSCTSNVTVYDSKNKYYLLTAGHCSKVGVKWTQGGKDIGTMVSRIYSGNTDAAIISMDSGRKGKYIYAHKPSDIKISGVQSLSGETVGDIVCKAGATTGFSCGELLDKNYSVYDLTQWWKGLRKASYSSAGGDSGAPVITTNATNYLIVGIHKGKDNSNGYTIYTHIQNALNNLGGLKVYY